MIEYILDQTPLPRAIYLDILTAFLCQVECTDQDNKFIKNKYIILVYEQETLLRIITK